MKPITRTEWNMEVKRCLKLPKTESTVEHVGYGARSCLEFLRGNHAKDVTLIGRREPQITGVFKQWLEVAMSDIMGHPVELSRQFVADTNTYADYCAMILWRWSWHDPAAAATMAFLVSNDIDAIDACWIIAINKRDYAPNSTYMHFYNARGIVVKPSGRDSLRKFLRKNCCGQLIFEQSTDYNYNQKLQNMFNRLTEIQQRNKYTDYSSLRNSIMLSNLAPETKQADFLSIAKCKKLIEEMDYAASFGV